MASFASSTATQAFGTSSSLDFVAPDSSELQETSQDLLAPLCFTSIRHEENARRRQPFADLPPWRLRERMKTVSVALVVCLNVGVDPPDAPKFSPCARMECWTDPFGASPIKALESIGASLQRQYERWQPRARYKQSLDPTVDDVKRLVTSLRRNAKDERVLFHYNGHGVPRPTRNGECWVFNKQYTQYIPLSIYDLQTWMGSPSIYVWDCNNAGIIVEEFRKFVKVREEDRQKCSAMGMTMSAPSLVHNAVQLASCGPDETLPQDKSMPADLFTSCLTTPIKASLRWWFYRSIPKVMVPGVTGDMLEKIPGRLNDRRTPLGELNWIFTAITDTIAWEILPTDVFQDLFRHDLLVASLFRNYLLAELVMTSFNCTPISSPAMPSAKNHPMWMQWEMVMDSCIRQLPTIIQRDETYEHSTFFTEQLAAFAVWLRIRNINRSPPQQLPVILQVLLSPVHRYQALDLLGRYLEQGPKAVHTALNVGIFPYVVKLLQSTAVDLRPLLVFVWSKILAVDPTCRLDLVKDGAYKYFLGVLSEPNLPPHLTRNQHEYQAMAAFILSVIVREHPAGQEACLQNNLIASCLDLLDTKWQGLRQWVIICLGLMWNDYENARWCAVRDGAPDKLYALLADPAPEIRTAVVFTLGTFLSSNKVERTDQSNTIDQNVGNTLCSLVHDGSHLVREELCLVFRKLVSNFESQFLAAMMEDAQRQSQQAAFGTPTGLSSPSLIAMGGSSGSTPAVAASSSAAVQKRHSRTGSAGASTTLGIGLFSIGSSPNTSETPPASTANMGARNRGSDWVILPASVETELIDAGERREKAASTQRGGNAAPVSSRKSADLQNKDQAQSPRRSVGPGMFSVGSNSSPGSQGGSPGTLPGSIHLLPPPPSSAGGAGSQPLVYGSRATSGNPIGGGAHFNNMWTALLLLATDPHLEVSMMADKIIKRLRLSANQSRSNSLSLPSSPRSSRGRRVPATSSSSDSPSNSASSGVTPSFDLQLPQFKRGNLPRLKSVPGTSTTSVGFSLSDLDANREDSKSATIPRSMSVQHFGTSGPRIHEDYFDNFPGDLNEVVDQFNTGFVDWMSSSFILSAEEWDRHNDPGRKKHLEQHWRLGHNAKIRSEAKAMMKDSPNARYRLEDQVFVNRNPESPQSLLFHPYQNELFAADKSNVTVWDWELGMQINTLHNHPHSSKARIATLDLINPHDVSLLMVGTDDGCVRVWRDYNHEGGGSQVAAWRAITDLLPTNRSSGNSVPSLVLDWEQESGVLFASGNSRIIRIWDTQQEQIIQDIPTLADTCVTSLTSDVAGRSSLIAGCGDGSIRLYDRRVPPGDCLVKKFHEHHSWVVKVYLQQGASQGKIISAGVGGDIRYWDPRFQESTAKINTNMRISCMDVHHNAPLMAVGSRDQLAKIYHIDSQESLCLIKYHEGFMGQRIASVNALAFHPYKICMAAGFSDSLISIYADEKKKL